ncbi:helix-turn-helix domain-containing protein [Solirubrobacter sp. CPCC 204708]|uniref:Helix-turn-helix domain-containing protein n=1 Tax=Solirubrobacter deserti TaxID=2282478 RepID=A0ABT4RF89_9ACTN|nr:PucR family transcriptional regulator [Solirubrobacter deserti]MBE2319555.1 helix-turn-helix domain-containing protein [Solirubrobacter deserti]MDA0137158.1 helix-turn-helix domain-containing protein [Solirubrobacter deserti]
MDWDGLLDALEREQAASVERTVEHMRALRSYAEVPVDSMRLAVRANHVEILAGLRLRRPPQPADATTIFRSAGGTRARQRVAVSDMLAAWRVGQERLYQLAASLVPEAPGRDALLREFLELEVRWVDFAMLAAADGHRDAELSLAREQEHVRASLLRRAMTGAAAPAELRAAFSAAGLDPHAAYRAAVARPADFAALERHLGLDRPPVHVGGLGARIDGELCALLTRLPEAPAPVPIGVSAPAAPQDFRRAFERAHRALEVGLALGADGVFDLEGLGLRPAVLADEQVGEILRRRYLEPFSAAPVIVETVARFLDNDANAELTARELGVHVNTVRHRLGRFEQATGRSLRETETLVEVWWALQRARLA